mgnify:FL=1
MGGWADPLRTLAMLAVMILASLALAELIERAG